MFDRRDLDVHTETLPVAGLLADAFVDLETAVYLVADPAERRRAIRAQFALLATHALTHGGIATRHVGTERAGAVVWFDHTKPVPPIPDYEAEMRRTCGHNGEFADAFFALDQVMDTHHPTEAHYYVALVGVRSAHRGNGIATGLLRDLHATFDADGVPAYLEAVSEHTAGLYATLGYRLHGDPFAIGEGGPVLYPMWRDPQS